MFHQEWEDFQFSILGANGLTEIKNANQASIDGLEMDVNWAATYNLQLSAGVAFYDAKLTENYCGFDRGQRQPVTDVPTARRNLDGRSRFPTDRKRRTARSCR